MDNTLAQHKHHAPEQGVSLATVLTLCVLTCIITLMVFNFGPRIAAKAGLTSFASIQAGSKVVTLDFERLLAAGLQRAMLSPNAGPEVQAQAHQFNAQVAQILERYAAGGVVVINHKALIGPSAQSDITDAIILEMGLGR